MRVKKGAEPYLVKYPHLTNQHWTIDQINAHADAALDYYRSNFTEPYFSAYFTAQGLHPQTYARWQSQSEYFAAAYQMLRQMQKERLTKWLLSKDNPTAGLIFAIKNVTDWSDTPAQDETDEFTIIDNWTDGRDKH